ncbi:MAG: hypothetical protein HY320_06785 [Armatimonadetes bacterium]|nr:hypothetical protein [Armatimonadota bacterium]
MGMIVGDIRDGLEGASSFFDVFFEIEVRILDGTSNTHNEEPARVTTIITGPRLPPFEDAYRGFQPTALRDPNGNVVGRLRHLQHVPVRPSTAKIKRELIKIEKKLDRILFSQWIPPDP